MLKFYTIQGGGRLTSCVGICLWLLEELQREYKIIHVDLDKMEHKSEDFLRLNPNGKVPALIDGNFVIWESVAINYYLARKYKPELLGKSIEETSLIDQWTIWMVSEFQPHVSNIFKHSRLPGYQRDVGFMDFCKSRVMYQTDLLEKELNGKQYLVGNKFSLADLNVASYASIHYTLHNDLSVFPNFAKWLNNMTSRPALKSVIDKNLVIM